MLVRSNVARFAATIGLGASNSEQLRVCAKSAYFLTWMMPVGPNGPVKLAMGEPPAGYL
jgi:hypothetical protein